MWPRAADGRRRGSGLDDDRAGHVGGRLHPVILCAVANDEYIRLRDERALAKSPAVTASPAAMLALAARRRVARPGTMCSSRCQRATRGIKPTERSAPEVTGSTQPASSRMGPAASSRRSSGTRARAQRRPCDVVLVERRPHDQPVAALRSAPRPRGWARCARCYATHVERVADDHAAEAELLRSSCQDARVQRRGLVASAGTRTCAVMIERTPRQAARNGSSPASTSPSTVGSSRCES